MRQAEDDGIPAVIERLGRIDLDDLGTEARQIRHRVRPGDHIAQVQDLDAFQPAIAGIACPHPRQLGLDAGQHRQRMSDTHPAPRSRRQHLLAAVGHPHHRAGLDHQPEFRVLDLDHQARRLGVVIVDPLLQPALRRTGELALAEDLLPFLGGTREEDFLHARRDMVRPGLGQRIDAQRHVGLPFAARAIGIRLLAHAFGDQRIVEAQYLQAALGVLAMTRTDHIEHAAILALVAAIEGIEQLLQLVVVEIHRLAFDTPTFDLLLALGLVALRQALDLDRVVAEPFHQRADQRYLDLVAHAGALAGLQRQHHRGSRQHGAIGRAQRQRREGWVDAHQHAVEAHVGEDAGIGGDHALEGTPVAAQGVIGGKAGNRQRDQLIALLP